MSTNVFLSAGRPGTAAQSAFLAATKAELVRLGLTPLTPGKDYSKNLQPLDNIERCMHECAGAIVVAYERILIKDGVESQMPASTPMREVRVPTLWNHVEGALAKTLGLPLLVIAEEGLQATAVLENRYSWTVLWVPLDPTILQRLDIADVLQDWKAQVESKNASLPPVRGSAETLEVPRPVSEIDRDPGKEGIGALLGRLRIGQLWAAGAAIVVLLGGATQFGRYTATLGTSAAVASSSPSSVERGFVDDSLPRMFLGDQISVSVRAVSASNDSAVLVLHLPRKAPDTLPMRMGDLRTFIYDEREYTLVLNDVRGGDGKRGTVDVLVAAKKPK